MYAIRSYYDKMPAKPAKIHFMESEKNVIQPLEKLNPKIVIVWLSIKGFNIPIPIIRGKAKSSYNFV